MKKIIALIFLFCFFNITNAQPSPDEMYNITYENTFKRLHSWKGYDKELSTLLVKGDSSIYQVYNIMRTDTLKATNPNFKPGSEGYFSYNKYAIKITGDTLLFSDVIANDEYFYKELLNFDWILGSKSDEIQGYNCRNATTTYAGRNWEAWYAVDLPINAGPYKFKGLPGLIIKITDDTRSYGFLFQSIKEQELRDFKKLKHLKPFEERIETTRKEFNALHYAFNSLDINGQLNFGKEGPPIRIEIISSDDGTSLRETTNGKRGGDLNFIEVDHKQ